MIITLTDEHIDLARRVARMRNASHRTVGRADGVVSADSAQADLDGAFGEIAVSVALREPWANAILSIEKWLLSRDNLPDVGRWEVKATRYRTGCLLLQKHAADQYPHVLALLHEFPRVTLRGWLYGWEAKQPKYWRTNVPKPCYMAPQKDLRHMVDLVGRAA